MKRMKRMKLVLKMKIKKKKPVLVLVLSSLGRMMQQNLKS